MYRMKEYNSEKALDLLVIDPGNWRRKEKKKAQRYNLDYSKMIISKVVYQGAALILGFFIGDLLYNTAPPYVTALVFAVYIIAVIFFGPLLIARISKK